MNESGRKAAEDLAVEALLEHALPRPSPPARVESIVRAAVHDEWKAVSGRYRRRKRLGEMGLAAAVLVALGLAFNVFRVNGIAAVEVATIDKEHGSIYVLGEQSELRELPDLTTVVAGQTIVTGSGSGVGLRWRSGNGSLRIDENSRVEFLSAGSVRLLSGRVYFDSQPVAAITGSGINSAGFVVETEFGPVAHVGTQYMTAVDKDRLTVSVREGEVRVGGRYSAVAGQQLQLNGTAPPSVTNVSHSGSAWEWTEEVAPRLDIGDGRSTYEFLQWVGRETGLEVRFASPEAEAIAHAGELRGTIATSPRKALDVWMAGELLRTEINDGKIVVSAINAGSRN